MSHDLPEDWYEEHDGQRLVLNSKKVAAEIDRLRTLFDAKVTPGYELLAGTIEIREAEIEQLRAERQAIIAACAACVPTTWLDSLLTGPSKVADFGKKVSNSDIEKLLTGVRNRILALSAADGAKP